MDFTKGFKYHKPVFDKIVGFYDGEVYRRYLLDKDFFEIVSNSYLYLNCYSLVSSKHESSCRDLYDKIRVVYEAFPSCWREEFISSINVKQKFADVYKSNKIKFFNGKYYNLIDKADIVKYWFGEKVMQFVFFFIVFLFYIYHPINRTEVVEIGYEWIFNLGHVCIVLNYLIYLVPKFFGLLGDAIHLKYVRSIVTDDYVYTNKPFTTFGVDTFIDYKTFVTGDIAEKSYLYIRSLAFFIADVDILPEDTELQCELALVLSSDLFAKQSSKVVINVIAIRDIFLDAIEV